MPTECQTVRIRSSPTKCWAWSGSILFTKVISRRQKSSLAGKELTTVSGFEQTLQKGINSVFLFIYQFGHQISRMNVTINLRINIKYVEFYGILVSVNLNWHICVPANFYFVSSSIIIFIAPDKFFLCQSKKDQFFFFFYFSTQTYTIGTQKHLVEMLLPTLQVFVEK